MDREKIEFKIQELIDGKLTQEEAQAIHQEMKKDESLMMFYNILKDVDDSMQHIKLEHPSINFTAGVMSNLHLKKSSFIDFNSIIIFLGIVVCAAVGLIYSSQIDLNVGEIAPMNTTIPLLNEVNINVPRFDLPSSDVFFKIFYFGILFMALIYFDRVILKQIFRSDKFST